MDPFSGPSLTLRVCEKELSSNICTKLGSTFIRKGTERSGSLPVWAEIDVEETLRFFAVFKSEMQFSLSLYLNLILIQILASQTAILTFPNKKVQVKQHRNRKKRPSLEGKKCPDAREVREPDRLTHGVCSCSATVKAD